MNGTLAQYRDGSRTASEEVFRADSKAIGALAPFVRTDDADRLSDGHTLIVDSYNDRVVEVDEEGTIVWVVKTGGLPYDADRPDASHAGEGSSDRPTASGAGLQSRGNDTSSVVDTVEYGLTLLKYTIPGWLSTTLLALGVLAGVGAGLETYRVRR